MRFDSLAEWLRWQETLHPRAIDLGLERCQAVAERMQLRAPPFPVVSVAGTNGKGSSVVLLEAILRASGHRVGAYTSPHLLRYNERIRIGGEEVEDAALVAAFERVDQARGDISLTYFEFGTLAAMDLFSRREVEVALLEVGLGGRLDAVNVFDADVALVTTVAIDHVEWLGSERERIAREKAGIFRPDRPAVYADADVPDALQERACELGARLFRAGQEFGFERDANAASWSWRCGSHARHGLPAPALPGTHQYQNAAGALMVLAALEERLRVSEAAIRAGLTAVRLPGRLQILPGRVERIVDVAHNVQAAQALAHALAVRPCRGRTHAVLAMLGDKDVCGAAAAMDAVVDAWYVAGLDGPRAISAQATAQRLGSVQLRAPVAVYQRVADAYGAALAAAAPADRVVTFGSFHTAAEILRLEL